MVVEYVKYLSLKVYPHFARASSCRSPHFHLLIILLLLLLLLMLMRFIPTLYPTLCTCRHILRNYGKTHFEAEGAASSFFGFHQQLSAVHGDDLLSQH
jgi:hypothetical protein